MTHPARFSPEIVDLVSGILLARWPDFMGRPVVHDPFAGTGERLRAMCNGGEGAWSSSYSGTEIEADFIEAPGIIHGSATDPETYPPATHLDETMVGGWIVFTSPVYPNGMADNFRPRDNSKRRTYRSHLIDVAGRPDVELEEQNMARFGYRGTKRPEDGGTSKRRASYWLIAHRAMINWRTAQLAIVNVSDFMHSNGDVEPVVDDWSNLLRQHGWGRQIHHPVATKRMGHGSNRDQRAACEVVIVAERDDHEA